MAAVAGHCSKEFFRFFTLLAVIDLMNHVYTDASDQQKISLGYIWENPRHEEHNAVEVLVDGSRNELRLTCILDPPLPVTKENFLERDKIVKWMNIRKTHGHQLKQTFWSDDQAVTAVSLTNLRLRDLGTYGCSYRSILKTINITVSNLEEVKKLPEPTSHHDLEGVVLNSKDPKGLEKWKPLSQSLEQVPLGLKPFPCQVPNTPTGKPNSVHKLKPGDIDIILSLGGAISSGIAANSSTVPGLFVSHKTLSFSIGGKWNVEQFISLPSILKKFNANLKGAVIQEEDFSTIHYGSSIRQLPLRTNYLIKKLESRRDIDFNSSWKLLTLSLDFDDYCVACRLPMGWNDQIKSVVEALDTLYMKIPRLFVNLVMAPNVSQLYNLPSSKACPLLYRKTCECLEASFDEDKRKVDQMQTELKNHLTEVIQKYNTRPDFAVVIQPFWTNIDKDKNDLFARDCFHLSATGQELVAVNLWNNMLQPNGQKRTNWNLGKAMRCPTENHPYLFTWSNGPKDDTADFSVANDMEAETLQVTGPKSKSSSKLKVALGVGLSLFVVVVVIVGLLLYTKRNRPISMRDRIRILATPWKRMKEKV
eukprot:Seg1768.5 transcript_id=Seg1768.5/GoldUCD/mRNA.D3Y31 product="Phospholipase B1 membrane-associated" protein_id=Seg1768.5/GoldUCD/D3Y31